MKDSSELSYEDILERIVRLVLFSLMMMLLLKTTNRSDQDILLMTAIGCICFMVVNSQYPVVVYK